MPPKNSGLESSLLHRGVLLGQITGSGEFGFFKRNEGRLAAKARENGVIPPQRRPSGEQRETAQSWPGALQGTVCLQLPGSPALSLSCWPHPCTLFPIPSSFLPPFLAILSALPPSLTLPVGRPNSASLPWTLSPCCLCVLSCSLSSAPAYVFMAGAVPCCPLPWSKDASFLQPPPRSTSPPPPLQPGNQSEKSLEAAALGLKCTEPWS